LKIHDPTTIATIATPATICTATRRAPGRSGSSWLRTPPLDAEQDAPHPRPRGRSPTRADAPQKPAQDTPGWANTACGTKRLDNDVSAVADPYTGFDIYDIEEGGWLTIGGTSLSSPLVSSLYALAGGGGGVSYPAATLYSLLLSRLMIEIARDEVLGPELVMRGGTCLNKLHLPEPLRYSEDLDYVRSTRGGIKPYTQALAKVAEGVGLTVSSRQRSGQMVHVYFDAQPTEGIGRIRIKIEMNIVETEPHRPRKTIPHTVDTSWWSGAADIPTFQTSELLATKLRALYLALSAAVTPTKLSGTTAP
jgi:hypothetical protein